MMQYRYQPDKNAPTIRNHIAEHAISHDLTALKNSIEQLIKYMYDDTIG